MLAFIVTLIIAAISTPVVIQWYKKNKWLDDPEQETHAKKTHKNPVPRGGGVIIFVSILLASFFFLSYDHYLAYIMIAAALLMLVGFLDENIVQLLRLGDSIQPLNDLFLGWERREGDFSLRQKRKMSLVTLICNRV